jgi:glycosyltransferase involved in cell wall biosynthesis
MPKISVCIPTYNSARYLPEAIESVLEQDFDDYELIICDNASTDNTTEICRSYTDSRIRYVRFEKLVTQGGNWNRCIALAQGQYVALLHADDKYLPGFLKERSRLLEENPEIGLAFGAVQIIDSDGRPISEQRRYDEAFIAPPPEFAKELLLSGCVISPVSPMVRRDCYKAVGPFNERRLWAVDWEMWFRIAAHYGVAYSPKINACYRVHNASGTSVVLLEARNGAEQLEAVLSALNYIEGQPELAHLARLRPAVLRRLAVSTFWAASYNLEQNNIPGVWRNLYYAAKADKWILSRPTFWALLASCCFGPKAYRAYSWVRSKLPRTVGSGREAIS